MLSKDWGSAELLHSLRKLVNVKALMRVRQLQLLYVSSFPSSGTCPLCATFDVTGEVR